MSGKTTPDYDAVIVGAGFSGIYLLHKLRDAGFNVLLIDAAAQPGGIWYWNRYPGASCDIESYIYFPLLEETKFIPKHKYTNAPETLEYIAKISEKFNLAENAIFQTAMLAEVSQEQVD